MHDIAAKKGMFTRGNETDGHMASTVARRLVKGEVFVVAAAVRTDSLHQTGVDQWAHAVIEYHSPG